LLRLRQRRDEPGGPGRGRRVPAPEPAHRGRAEPLHELHQPAGGHDQPDHDPAPARRTGEVLAAPRGAGIEPSTRPVAGAAIHVEGVRLGERSTDATPAWYPAPTRMSIRVVTVSKRFDDFLALDNLSLEVPSGALLALLGPSGSGKTTLLRIIAGLEVPDTGSVRYDGEDVTELSVGDRNVGFVFQHYALFRQMSVFDNIAFAMRVRGWPAPRVRERVETLLRLIQLEGLERLRPGQLSGGQRQRVALARALAAEPKVLLLDE